MVSLYTRISALLMALAITSPLYAQTPLQVGDTLSPITLEDQHGKARTVDGKTLLVLFTRDMNGGKVMRKLFDKRSNAAELLAAAHAEYLSDVSEMPSMIRRLMALPAMRKRPYPIILDTEGEVTAHLPTRPESVTILSLDNLNVTNISYAIDAKQLQHALKLILAEAP